VPHSSNLVAIYPGSFDPVTNGHLDLIERARAICGHLIVAILSNEDKKPMFTAAERVEMVREAVASYQDVEVDSFDGLLVDYAQQRGCAMIVRGIRAISDYENEMQMTLMNRRLRPEIETVFLMPNEAYSFLSSRIVKEVFRLGGSVSGLVSTAVEARLRSRIHGDSTHNL
jgi:pantetheine-phosphate adenylyltransferase